MRAAVFTLSLLACTPTSEHTDTDTDTVDTDEAPQGDLLIAGTWSDPWGGEHVVTNDAWSAWDYSHALTRHDNDAGWVVGQNDAGNPMFGDLWSRFDWTWDQGDLYYCQSAYEAASEQAALDTAPPDPSNPTTTGCAGFAWTALRERLPLTGSWVDDWGGSHVIDAFAWRMDASAFRVLSADVVDGVIVAENDATNEYFPGLYSRFDSAWVDGEGWFFCQTAYDASSRSAAEATPAADHRDLDTGCGGFAWSHLRPVE